MAARPDPLASSHSGNSVLFVQDQNDRDVTVVLDAKASRVRFSDLSPEAAGGRILPGEDDVRLAAVRTCTMPALAGMA